MADKVRLYENKQFIYNNPTISNVIQFTKKYSEFPLEKISVLRENKKNSCLTKQYALKRGFYKITLKTTLN